MTHDPDPRAHGRALELALRALNARDRTEHELRAFLVRRNVQATVIEDVIDAVVAEGLIDDAGYARRFAEDRRSLDQWGSDRIARDLERRGVPRELVERALATYSAGDELDAALGLLERRFPQSLANDRERDKAWRMLVRRGYEAELAYAAVRRHEQGRRDAA